MGLINEGRMKEGGFSKKSNFYFFRRKTPKTYFKQTEKPW